MFKNFFQNLSLVKKSKFYQIVFKTKLKYLFYIIISYLLFVLLAKSIFFFVNSFYINRETILICQDDLIKHGFLNDENDKNFKKYEKTLENLKKFHISIDSFEKFGGIKMSAVPFKIEGDYLYLATNRHCLMRNNKDISKNIKNKKQKWIIYFTIFFANFFLWKSFFPKNELSRSELNFENNKNLEEILEKNEKTKVFHSEKLDLSFIELKIDPNKKNLITKEFKEKNFPKFDHNEFFQDGQILYSVSSTHTFNKDKKKIIGSVLKKTQDFNNAIGNITIGASGSCFYDEKGNVFVQCYSGNQNIDKYKNNELFGNLSKEIELEFQELVLKKEKKI